ncbi:MAG: DUF512 domain-containing protein [Clostridia bacterium]|nr:DUF512 domain-containing protein [Clostridia bacterium]
MRKADTTIKYIEPYSIAEEAGLEIGDKLISINGHDFHDILEYRYLTAEYEVTLEVLKKDGTTEMITVENDYEDLGIEFAEGLIDEAQSCKNKCIFCFIDQLPKGMRETVYFKDDDTRLSFLQGNYVTLTNMSDEEIDRLIKMRVSPINVSVHATEPELRCKMLNNRFAGKCYDIMKRFAENDIYMNCQIVLCPGINDGENLKRTLSDLGALFPNVNSISVVPVGLTRYRDGLYPLTPFTKESSAETIRFVEEIQNEFLEKLGTRLVYLSDEFYVDAGIPVPDAESYEGFPQIENGVGLIASMQEEFDSAMRLLKNKKRSRHVSVATGEIAEGFIKGLAEKIEQLCEGVKVDVYPIKNNFFGGGVSVSGLVCGCDIIKQLKDKIKTDTLLIPHSMLRDDDNIFLDDTTVEDVEKALDVKIVPVLNDGYEFVEKILDEELEF